MDNLEHCLFFFLPDCSWNSLKISECEYEADHVTGDYAPYSLRTVCGFLKVPQNLYSSFEKGCRKKCAHDNPER